MELWSVPVFTEYTRNVFLIDLKICDGTPLTKSRQYGYNQPYVKQNGTHQICRKYRD